MDYHFLSFLKAYAILTHQMNSLALVVRTLSIADDLTTGMNDPLPTLIMNWANELEEASEAIEEVLKQSKLLADMD